MSSGLVGFFAYDLVRRLERLPSLATDDLGLPDLMLLLATDVAAVDHHEGTITLIANAVNWNGTDERVDSAYDDAVARIEVMTEALAQPLHSMVATFSRPAPMHRSQRTSEEYSAIVERLVGEIEAGEVFQVVPSQRFEMDTVADPLDVYRAAAILSPSRVCAFSRTSSMSTSACQVARSTSSGNGQAVESDVVISLSSLLVVVGIDR